MKKITYLLFVAIVLIASCNLSGERLIDPKGMLSYMTKVSEIADYEGAKKLTDEYISQLREEVELYVNEEATNKFDAGRYSEAKEEWVNSINKMDLSEDEKSKLIEYYKEQVADIVIE